MYERFEGPTAEEQAKLDDLRDRVKDIEFALNNGFRAARTKDLGPQFVFLKHSKTRRVRLGVELANSEIKPFFELKWQQRLALSESLKGF